MSPREVSLDKLDTIDKVMRRLQGLEHCGAIDSFNFHAISSSAEERKFSCWEKVMIPPQICTLDITYPDKSWGLEMACLLEQCNFWLRAYAIIRAAEYQEGSFHCRTDSDTRD